jgi:hypothetical protein
LLVLGSEQYSSQVSGPVGTFTAEECRVKWLGGLHPSVNRGPWLDEEVASLKALVGHSSEKEVDWVMIAEDLGVCTFFLLSSFLALH